MNGSLLNPQEEGKPKVDYTGTKIGLAVGPIIIIFGLFGRLDTGLTVAVVLGMAMVAAKTKWYLRAHAWFWAAIAVVLALNVPLVLLIRWPQNVPTLTYVFPFGIADFALIRGAIALGEKIFLRTDEDTAAG